MIGDCILFDLVVNEAYYRVSVQSVASLGMQWKMFSKVVTVSFFFCMGGAVPFDVLKNINTFPLYCCFTVQWNCDLGI
jgi:hypothetical protein